MMAMLGLFFRLFLWRTWVRRASLILGQVPSHATFGNSRCRHAPRNVEDAVEDLVEVDGARSSTGLGRWQEVLEPFLLGARQIGGVAFGFHTRYENSRPDLTFRTHF